MCDKPFKKLPETVKPEHYKLSLTVDLKSFTFVGEVGIQFKIYKPTSEIILHAVDLELHSVVVKDGNNSIKPTEILLSLEEETVCCKFASTISSGSHYLNISFCGQIKDNMRGLYRSKYINGQVEVYSAVTQFASTDARRCFPCWDEPALKATFDVSLTASEGLTALSNMPVKNIEVLGKLVKYNFETTPVMSTYLVAAVIGTYDYVEDKSSDGVLVRVYTPKGKKEQGVFALKVATKVLPYYKDYFKVPYPLPKLDLIAIADFSFGAMENWGLITYRETRLLVDPNNTSAENKQIIALVVGHELAHQWFGNLVTMEWWTHLWLNEGYASFVQFLCVDYLFPEYNIWTQFVNNLYTTALELDSLNNSHLIEVPIANPSEINEIFDAISYNKGASIIRMLYHYIGDDKFRSGMHLYLTKYQYKNTSTEDLWASLEQASQKPVGEVMSTWTKQMGFPVVNVSSKPTEDGKGVVLTLSQSKFTADGSKPLENYLWSIPISISSSKHPLKEEISILLKTQTTEIVMPSIEPSGWLKINPGTVGFYRTQYSAEMLEKFVPDIRNQKLPSLDRLGLLDDLFAMVRAGHTNTVEVLKLLRCFEDEPDYNVWCSIVNILKTLGHLLDYTDYRELFERYEQQLFHKVYKKLGWNENPNDTHLETLLRSLILDHMALLNDENMLKEAKVRFALHVKSENILQANLRCACYRSVLQSGGKVEYDMLLQLYRSTELHEEKNRIIKALGAAKDLELLKETLEFSMSQEVRPQDSIFVILSVASTKVGQELAWTFFKDNLEKIRDRLSAGTLLPRLIKQLTSNFADEEMSKQVQVFFQKNTLPGTERAIQQAVENITLKAAWLKRDSEAIKAYLTSYE